MPTLSKNTALLAIVATFVIIAAVLGWAFIGQVIVQRRRLRKTNARFAGRLLAAHDEERASLARELHDDIIHRLVAMLAVARKVDGSHDAVELEQLVNDLRQLARGMHPAVLDHLEFADCLTALAKTTKQRHNITVNVHVDPTAPPVTEMQKQHLYRVVQEAVGNALRHSGCSNIGLLVTSSGQEITVTIQDDGHGFAPHALEAMGGLGLTSMQERLRLCRGTLDVSSTIGKGTTVMARVPVMGHA